MNGVGDYNKNETKRTAQSDDDNDTIGINNKRREFLRKKRLMSHILDSLQGLRSTSRIFPCSLYTSVGDSSARVGESSMV